MKKNLLSMPSLRRVSTPAATLALALGILIWMKLRLVTGLPRSVYAEPERPLPPTAPTTAPTTTPTTTPAKPVTVDTADKSWRPDPSEPPATPADRRDP